MRIMAVEAAKDFLEIPGVKLRVILNTDVYSRHEESIFL